MANTHSRVTPIVNRTVKSSNIIQDEAYPYELKRIYVCSHTGVYYFSGWGDDPINCHLAVLNKFRHMERITVTLAAVQNYGPIGVPDDGLATSGGDAEPSKNGPLMMDLMLTMGIIIRTANVEHNGCWTHRLETSKENVASGLHITG